MSSWSGLSLLRVLGDTAAVVGALATAFLLRFTLGFLEVEESSTLTVRSHVIAALLWVAGVMVTMMFNRLYDEDTLFSGGGEFSRIVRSLLEATSMFVLFVFVTQSFYVSRSWLGLTVVFTGMALVAERSMMRSLVGRLQASGRLTRPLMLVTPRKAGRAPLTAPPEFDVRGTIEPRQLTAYMSGEPGAMPIQPGTTFLLRAGDFEPDELWRVVIEAGHRGHPVYLSSAVRSVHRDRLTVREIGGQTTIKVDPIGFAGARGKLKRATDLVLGTAFFLVALPLMLLISAVILITSGRPIFYSQERVGHRGETFSMIKFRTMKPEAEASTGPVWASPDDDRRTAVGSFLRRFSLDELPQLWNVLRGDMSLVGPRPERPFFADTFDEEVEWYRYRTRTKPGITGLAQCRGLRGNSSLESRVDLDNWYIEHWSISLDLKIMLKSVGEIIKGENAY